MEFNTEADVNFTDKDYDNIISHWTMDRLPLSNFSWGPVCPHAQ